MDPTSTPRARARGRTLHWTAPLRDLVVVILLLAGIFDWLSGNPIHGLLLIAVAGALAREDLLGTPQLLDRGPGLAPESTPVGRGLTRTVGVIAILIYATLVGGFGRYSWPATVSVLIPGAVALLISLRGPLRHQADPGPTAPIGVVAWSSVFIGLGLWELTQLLLQPSLTTDSWPHPTISVMTDPALATHPGRTLALAAWLGLGWFVLTR